MPGTSGAVSSRRSDAQHALGLAAPDGEEAMRRDRRDGLAEVGVLSNLVGWSLVLAALRDLESPPRLKYAARSAADLGVLGDALGDDVARAGQRGVGVGHTFFRVDEARRLGRAGCPEGGCAGIRSASGSRPRSRAIVARVRRLGLNGR